MKLAGFETWKKQSRHLEPCSKISEEMPPLEAHHCTQDKAKEEEDNKTHNFSLNLSIVSLLLISKSKNYKGKHLIYSLRGAEK